MAQDSPINTDKSSIPDNPNPASTQQTPAETPPAIAAFRPKMGGESTAVLNIVTAATKQPKDGSERLKPYRWAKGRSGNPGGRPKKLPLSKGLRAVIEMPVAAEVKSDLEEAVGGTLPKSFTWGDAYALAHFLDMFSKLRGFKLATAREIRLAVEGRETHRIEIAEAHTETVEDIKKGLWAWFGEKEYERCKLFNMPVPEETIKMAEQIGVPLELPPCQQEQMPRKGKSSEASFQSARNSPSKPAQ